MSASRLAYTVGCLLLLHPSIEAAPPITIDSFDSGPFELTFPEGYNYMLAESFGDGTTVAGGRRLVSIGPETSETLPHSTAGLRLGDGYLEYNRQQNCYFDISYGYLQSGGFPFHLNLTAGGLDRFTLELLEAPGPVEISLIVSDSIPSTFSASSSLSGSGPGRYEWPFSAFPSINFSNLDGVELQIASAGAPINGPGIYRLGDLSATSAVPEPGEYGIASAIGLVGWIVGLRWYRSSHGTVGGDGR